MTTIAIAVLGVMAIFAVLIVASAIGSEIVHFIRVMEALQR